MLREFSLVAIACGLTATPGCGGAPARTTTTTDVTTSDPNGAQRHAFTRETMQTNPNGTSERHTEVTEQTTAPPSH